jgi:hypothetical protein
MTPLALSNEQLQDVMGLAAQLHPRRRHAFLAMIADELTNRQFNDRDVRAVATMALRRMLGPPPHKNGSALKDGATMKLWDFGEVPAGSTLGKLEARA